MVELNVDQSAIKAVVDALRAETNGKALRRDLIREMRGVMGDANNEAKQAVLAIPTQGAPHDGAPLRQAIASQIKTEVRLSGRSTGTAVRVRARNMPRGFRLAARRLNREGAWRHRVYGRDVWVEQRSPKPGWFDDPMKARRPQMRAGVLDAVDAMAARIRNRVRSRT